MSGHSIQTAVSDRGLRGGRDDARIVVIGGGSVAELWHLPAAVELLGPQCVAIAEPDAGRREALAGRFGLTRTAADYRELLGDVEAAVVLTPPHLHPSITIDCLEAGVPVLCEKPIANGMAECQAMLRAARRCRLRLAAGHNYRLFPSRRAARDLLLSGALGAHVSIEIEEGHPAGWPSQTGYTFRKGWVAGGVLQNNGIHSLDFLLWCLGDPKSVFYVDDAIGGVESNARVELEFANGGRGVLHVSRTCRLANRIRMCGEAGRIELGTSDLQTLVHDGREVRIPEAEAGGVTHLRGTIRAQLADFLRAVREGDAPACDGTEAARAVELIERCYAQKRRRPLPQAAPVPGAMY